MSLIIGSVIILDRADRSTKVLSVFSIFKEKVYVLTELVDGELVSNKYSSVFELLARYPMLVDTIQDRNLEAPIVLTIIDSSKEFTPITYQLNYGNAYGLTFEILLADYGIVNRESRHKIMSVVPPNPNKLLDKNGNLI